MFEKLNKQSAIAIAIVVILGIFAIVGTVIFLKDNGSTDAAEIASENSSNSETAEKPSEENNENNQANSSDSSDKNEQNQNNNTNNNNQGNNTSNNQQRQNKNVGTNETTNEGANTNRVNTENRTTVDNTEVASSDIDTIQGSTITRVTEGDLVKVTDDRNVGWNQMDFEIQSASAKIDGEKSKITIEKKVTTKTGSNFTTQGEEIEYTLIATNNSDEDLKGIEVSDNIPEKTTYVENSASNDVNVIRENDTVVGLKWYVDISAGKSVELKFNVKVNEDAEGTISNLALTNGNTPSDEVKTAIITAEKNGTISRDGVILEKQPAKLNDIITYTINVENTGDIEGTTIVKDQKLGEILNSKIGEMYGDVIITDNNGQKEYSPEELINGIEINIKEKSKATVTFSIKVVKIDGKIINFATTGDNEEPTNEDEKDTYGFDVKKELTKIERDGKSINTKLPAKQGDILTYTISIHNAGSVDLNNLDVTDKLPEELSKQSATEFTNVSVKAGDTIELKVKARVENVNGTIVNKVLVEDKDENKDQKEDTETTETIGFTIKKEATLIKADINKENKEYLDKAEVGDTIHYTITVENTGSVILKNLVIEDSKIDVKETIDLEDIYVIEKDYTVTPKDFVKLADGTVADIHNQATASYTDTENPDNNITKEAEKDVPAREKYGYKVNYLEKDTNKVLHNQKVQGGMTFESTVTSADEVITIDGYNYDSVDKDTLTITTGENVINIYYTGIPNIVVNKAQSGSQDEKVEYGDTITYTIKAENKGTATGSVTIEDKIPDNSELSGDIILTKNGTTNKIEKSDLEAGEYSLTLDSKETATITFTVTVNGYAGKEVTNTAKYQKENETKQETNTVSKKIEDTANVISTTTTTTSVTTPQKAILVLDVSGSMNKSITQNSKNSKLATMKTAVNKFLTKFLPTGTENEVMIITYSEYANVKCGFTSNKNTAYNSIVNIQASGGTNIDDGLTKANRYITEANAKNTSVILMTDGLPCYYMVTTDEGYTYRAEQGDGSYYAAIPANHAKEAAQLIKNKGSKAYSIGFGLNSIPETGKIRDENNNRIDGNSRQEAKNLMKNIATSEKEYFDSYDENKLNEAFESIAESITKTDESAPISYETQIGKITIPNENEEIFKTGQNVEIYKGEYQKGISQPYHTYSWNDFINLKKNIAGSEVQLVEYNATSRELKFDLGKYMESEGMSANENVTIRFIDSTANSQANTLTFTNSDIVVQGTVIEINEDDEENETQNLTKTTKMEVVQNPTQTTELPEKVEEKIEAEEDSNKINEIEKQEDVKQDEKTDSKNSEDSTSNEENTVNEEVTETDSEVKEEAINESIQIEQEQNLIEEEQNMLDENSTISE